VRRTGRARWVGAGTRVLWQHMGRRAARCAPPPLPTTARGALPARRAQRLLEELSCPDRGSDAAPDAGAGAGADGPALEGASSSGGGGGGGDAYGRALARAVRLINFRERASGELQGRLLEDGYEPRTVARAVLRVQQLVGPRRRPKGALPCSGRSKRVVGLPARGRRAAAYRRLFGVHVFVASTVEDPLLANPSALKTQGLLDDGRFARMYARGRWRTSARAPAQIARVRLGWGRLPARGGAHATAAPQASSGPRPGAQQRFPGAAGARPHSHTAPARPAAPRAGAADAGRRGRAREGRA
jgi:hypothetical protein